MDTRTLDQAPVNLRGGQRSYLLAGPEDSERLAVTWIESPRGSRQPVHRHADSEQVYVIVRGRGLMTVGAESLEVGEGTLVRVPPDTDHAIEGVSDEPLVVVTATVPPFVIAQDSVFRFER
jgi:mannose-6-phosphate isomerase-like protein (cupin superfamily)